MLRRQLIFHGAQSSGWFWFWLLSALLAGTLVFLLLRYERQLVSRKIGYTLLTLRLAVLVLFFLTMLQPVIAWTLNLQTEGRIVVAIDVSESMDTQDEHAERKEKLRWARALNMLAFSDEKLDAWEQAFASGAEPEWVSEAETRDEERAAELASVRKESLNRVFEDVGKASRRELALRLLTETDLLERLDSIAPVDVLLFAGECGKTDPELLVNGPSEIPITLKSGSTSVTSVLSDPQTSAGENESVLGVVLLSDGRDNDSRDPLTAARQLEVAGTRVFPVLMGSESRPRDLSIGELEYPQTVFKDDEAMLTANIRTAGFEGRDVTVVLERDGEQVETETIAPLGPNTSVEFELDATEIGRHAYSLRVEKLPVETRDDNNEQAFAMKVVDDNVNVLILDGEPRWEFRFLHTAFERDERVKVNSIVFTQPYLNLLDDTTFFRALPEPKNVEDATRAFAEIDIIILGDVAPQNLPDWFWPALESYVAETGGTLIMTAGKHHFPLRHSSQILKQLLPVTKLFPVDLNQPTETGPPNERGLRLKLTPDGERETMFQFAVDPLENRKIWGELPGHPWGMIGTAKPGATVFAHAFERGDRPDLEKERKSGAIVFHSYGTGQVLWLGVDSTWRWRFRRGDQFHHRFWGQLGRWAADNKAAAGNEFIRFRAQHSEVQEGEEIVLEARMTNRFARNNPDAKASVTVFSKDDPDKPITTMPLSPSTDQPLTLSGRIAALPPGEYTARLTIEGAVDQTEPLEAELFVHRTQTVELADLSSNRELLKEVAAASGGQLFEPHEARNIPDLLVGEEQDAESRHETTLWDHWTVMVAFFVLLTAEWVIRKLSGLP